MYEEGIVKVALELMDMGSLKDVIKGAKKMGLEGTVIPENIMAKML